MGKGEIQSHISGGKYSVQLTLSGRDRITAKIAQIDEQISALETKIAGMEEGIEKSIAQLQLTALQKRKTYYESNMPSDPTRNAWCADLTEDLSGIVGTVEVPGERGTVNIRPGYDDAAAFSAARDGQLQPVIASSPSAAFFNQSLLPGWQKWKPTYRYGTIVADSINFDSNTCSLCLDSSFSSQFNLDINQGQGFSECAAAAPGGFDQFCVDNPAHPT